MCQIRLTITLLAIAALLGLTGCATTLSYGPASAKKPYSVGYTDQDLGGGRYRVVYIARTSAGNAAAQDLALLRAAELTSAKGHSWLKLSRRSLSEIEVDRPRPTVSTVNQNMTCNQATSAGGLGCSYGQSDTSIAGVEIGTTGAYRRRLLAIVEFTMGDGAMPGSDYVFEAKTVAAKIRAKLLLK